MGLFEARRRAMQPSDSRFEMIGGNGRSFRGLLEEFRTAADHILVPLAAVLFLHQEHAALGIEAGVESGGVK